VADLAPNTPPGAAGSPQDATQAPPAAPEQAPTVFRGWAALQRAVNEDVPELLDAAEAIHTATLSGA